MPFPGAELSVETAFLGGGGEQYRLKSQKSWNLGAGCWISRSVFVESKSQDSGSDYLSLRWIDLQTFQPANCTLQCESWKLALRQERGDTNCNGCICRLAFSSHTSPHPFFFLERLRWSRAPTLGAAPERHCGVARQGAVLAVFRELLVPIPGAPALGHHTSSLASSLGASTTFNDRPALRWIN